MPTPYDGKVAVWYVHGRTVGEDTIDQVIDTIRNYAPAVDAVFVKIGEGSEWIGNIGAGDPKPDLAVRSPADIDRWVSKLARANLEFHAWAIPKGTNPAAEADFLIQACMRPGVKSLILDVEPFEGYFAGGRTAVRPFLLRLRGGVPAAFHVGMSVDPRPWHYNAIFPEEWRPFLNSIHPQVYWAEFGLTPDAGLQQAYGRWGGYGLPVIPTLQGFQGKGDKISREGMDRARVIALDTYKAPGLSWFRFGTLNKSLFPAVNVNIDGSVPGGGDDTKPVGVGRYGTEVIVKPGEGGYREGTYDGTPSPLRSFDNEEGWNSRYFTTDRFNSNVWVRWEPRLPASGFWEVSAYVASRHGTTLNARYKINGIVGQTTDLEVAIPQDKMDSLWVSLGIHQFDATNPNAGVVFLNDLTGESGREISFDAIRWRQVLGWQRPVRFMADGFDSPVGTAEERKQITTDAYPATWLLTLGYNVRYSLLGRESLHTGDDLVNRRGKTLGQQLYAVANGTVVTARREGKAPNWGSWGNVIIIRHDPLVSTGQVLYSRYGHVDNMQVKAGDRVVRGQHVAYIGDAYGVFRNAPHIHFDLSPSRILETAPGDWPWLDATRIQRDYTSPRAFIAANRPVKP